MTKRVIMPTTAEKYSEPFRVMPDRPVVVIAYGLAGDETAVIQVTPDNTLTWQPALLESGTLTATAYQTSIVKGGLFRVHKSATASPAGVSVD